MGSFDQRGQTVGTQYNAHQIVFQGTPSGAEVGNKIEELLQGPIIALGLSSQLAEAEVASPERAADLYEIIATKLGERGFGSLSLSIWRRHIEALESAGKSRQAFDRWCELTIQEIEESSAILDPTCLRNVGDRLASLGNNPVDHARHRALTGLADWFVDPAPDLTCLREGADTLATHGDAFSARALMWLAEAAIVDDQPSIVLERADALRKAAESAEQSVSVRIRLALADADGDWTLIVREARTRRLELKLAALVHARYGRWLAWSGEADGAEDSFRQALDTSARAGLPGDVAESLVSIVAVRQHLGPFDGSVLENHRLTEAVEGSGAVLRGRFDALRSALRYWRRDDKLTAHRALRRYLWESRLSGHFSSEFEARHLLADLYAEIDEPELAIRHYVRAGQDVRAGTCAKDLSDAVDVADLLRSPAPWVVAAALAVIEAEADLLGDNAIAELTPLLLRAMAGMRQSHIGPQVTLLAGNALAAVSARLPDAEVQRVVDLYEPLVDRLTDHRRRTDENMVATLVGLYRGHPTWRPAISDLLARCLTYDGLADQVRKCAHKLGDSHAQFTDKLEPLAASGNRVALDLLASIGTDSPSVLAEAERRVAAVLALEPKTDPHEGTLYDVDTTASLFARQLPEPRRVALARQWLRLAQDMNDAAINRAAALQGLGWLAPSLPPATRQDLFEPVFALVVPSALSWVDEFSDSARHPLSFLQINLSTDSLPQAALRTTARLAVRSAQGRLVEEAIVRALRMGDDGSAHAAAVALIGLNPDLVTLDLRPLAAHPSRWVRQTASILWARQAPRLPEIGLALAQDSDRSVRETMAKQLRHVRQAGPSSATALHQLLANDRSASVRMFAEEGMRDNE